MNEDSQDYRVLEQIVDWCNQLVEAINQFGNEINAFFNDRTYRNAVSFCVQQIGDLIPKLSDEFKTEHSDIQWDLIVLLRKELIGKIVSRTEGTLNRFFVWHVIQDALPMLYWNGNAMVFKHHRDIVENNMGEENQVWGNPPENPVWGNPPINQAWGMPGMGQPPICPAWGMPPTHPWGNPPNSPMWGMPVWGNPAGINPPDENPDPGNQEGEKPQEDDPGWDDSSWDDWGDSKKNKWLIDPGWDKGFDKPNPDNLEWGKPQEDKSPEDCNNTVDQAQPFEPAPIIAVTKEDVIKDLQGEWSSKENGFNYKMIFSGNTLQLGWDDEAMTEMPFDIKPGMPMQIVSPRLNYGFGGNRHHYRVEKLYFVNGRIAMFTDDDEVVLSRGSTNDELLKIESAIPKLNIVFNPDVPEQSEADSSDATEQTDDEWLIEKGTNDKAATKEEIMNTIQGKWVGRDNCYYVITIENDEFTLSNDRGYIYLKAKIYLSDKNPAHIELDNLSYRENERQSYEQFIYGVYYLDNNAVLLSIYSGCFGHKYEYILRRPATFGRFVMDDEILPKLQGFWVDNDGHLLAIHGNEIGYFTPNDNPGSERRDTFHIETESDYYHEIEKYTFFGDKGKELFGFETITYEGETDTIRASTFIYDQGIYYTDFKRQK